nr:MAG TPA: hypothetical protein [Bacteriophage sp.]
MIHGKLLTDRRILLLCLRPALKGRLFHFRYCRW